jgi:hypothetical protein
MILGKGTHGTGATRSSWRDAERRGSHSRDGEGGRARRLLRTPGGRRRALPGSRWPPVTRGGGARALRRPAWLVLPVRRPEERREEATESLGGGLSWAGTLIYSPGLNGPKLRAEHSQRHCATCARRLNLDRTNLIERLQVFDVVFSTPDNYHAEPLTFEVVPWSSGVCRLHGKVVLHL